MRAAHEAIERASIEGRYDDAETLLASAPTEYQAVFAAMSFVLKIKDVRACG